MNEPVAHIPRSFLAALAASTFAVGVLCTGYLWQMPKRVSRPTPSVAVHDLANDDEDSSIIPDEYKDPISLSVIFDPVVLCATGQVYDYDTLRGWFSTGHRICPKTNIEVQDAQVTRLPWLKQKVLEWMKQHNYPCPQRRDYVKDCESIHSDLPAWMSDIRFDTGQKRIRATTDIYELLRKWPEDSPEAIEKGKIIRTAVMEDMIWLLRYGDPYVQGVSASILSCCESPEEVHWLAATALVPTVILLSSPSNYTSQAATRLLFNLSRAGSIARRAIRTAGGLPCLIRIISTPRDEYGYCRDRAAATLAVLTKDQEAQDYIRKHAVGALTTMVTTTNDRWEKRDAATVLLKLQVPQEELSPDITLRMLCEYWWGSRAWLEHRVDSPSEGFTPEEFAARAEALQAHHRGNVELIRQLVVQQDPDIQDMHAHVEEVVVANELGLAGNADDLAVVNIGAAEDDGAAGP